MTAFAAKNITNMTVIEFGYQLTYNVKARDPVGSKNCDFNLMIMVLNIEIKHKMWKAA